MTRRRWSSAAVVVLLAVVGGVLALPDAHQRARAAQTSTANTDTVEKGDLSALVSGTGTLTYRARPDGSAYDLVNRSSGVYTQLPQPGDRASCGGVLYRVDNRPVVLLCGAVPAYRALRQGASGPDVRQLNANLRALGYAARAHVHLRRSSARFSPATGQALRAFQRRRGLPATGRLASGDVVFLPEPVRVAKISAQLGGFAQPGSPVMSATSNKLHVRVDLEASQQGDVHVGDRVQVTLPGNNTATGRVAGFGRTAQAQQGAQATDATVTTFIGLTDPAKADGLDQAPVDVDITTEGVRDVLSVPVTALVGKAGGGFAVEVVRTGGRRDLVGVRLGLFDTGGGRVQVEGALAAGDAVAVPSI